MQIVIKLGAEGKSTSEDRKRTIFCEKKEKWIKITRLVPNHWEKGAIFLCLPFKSCFSFLEGRFRRNKVKYERAYSHGICTLLFAKALLDFSHFALCKRKQVEGVQIGVGNESVLFPIVLIFESTF